MKIKIMDRRKSIEDRVTELRIQKELISRITDYELPESIEEVLEQVYIDISEELDEWRNGE